MADQRPSEAMPTSGLPRSEFSSYVDDLDHMSMPRDSQKDQEAAQQLAMQTSAFQNQDMHLDHLSASISRQHDLSLRMNEELELHSDLLHDMNHGVDNTQLRLGGANSRLEHFRQGMRENSM